jgi:hypothetical protein
MEGVWRRGTEENDVREIKEREREKYVNIIIFHVVLPLRSL